MDLTNQTEPAQKTEFWTFVFLGFILIPLLSVILVGGYGFAVWMSHLVFGPPSL